MLICTFKFGVRRYFTLAGPGIEHLNLEGYAGSAADSIRITLGAQEITPNMQE